MAQTIAQVISSINNSELRIAIEMLLTALASTGLTTNVTGNLTGNVTGNLTGDVAGDITLPKTSIAADTDLSDGDFDTSFIDLSGEDASCDISNWVPTPGKFYVITCSDVSTADPTVTLKLGATFDGTNDIATFDAAAESLVLFAISATRLVIVENVDEVALSFSGS